MSKARKTKLFILPFFLFPQSTLCAPIYPQIEGEEQEQLTDPARQRVIHVSTVFKGMSKSSPSESSKKAPSSPRKYRCCGISTHLFKGLFQKKRPLLRAQETSQESREPEPYEKDSHSLRGAFSIAPGTNGQCENTPSVSYTRRGETVETEVTLTLQGRFSSHLEHKVKKVQFSPSAGLKKRHGFLLSKRTLSATSLPKRHVSSP